MKKLSFLLDARVRCDIQCKYLQALIHSCPDPQPPLPLLQQVPLSASFPWHPEGHHKQTDTCLAIQLSSLYKTSKCEQTLQVGSSNLEHLWQSLEKTVLVLMYVPLTTNSVGNTNQLVPSRQCRISVVLWALKYAGNNTGNATNINKWFKWYPKLAQKEHLIALASGICLQQASGFFAARVSSIRRTYITAMMSCISRNTASGQTQIWNRAPLQPFRQGWRTPESYLISFPCRRISEKQTNKGIVAKVPGLPQTSDHKRPEPNNVCKSL